MNCNGMSFQSLKKPRSEKTGQPETHLLQQSELTCCRHA